MGRWRLSSYSKCASDCANSPVSVLGELSLLNELEGAELNRVKDRLLLLLARQEDKREEDHAESERDLFGVGLELLDEVGGHDGVIDEEDYTTQEEMNET